MEEKKVGTIAFAAMLLLTVVPLALAVDFQARVMRTPLQEDVLVLQAGTDEPVDVASSVIQGTLDSRNRAILSRNRALSEQSGCVFATSGLHPYAMDAVLRIEAVTVPISALLSVVPAHHASIVILVAHGTEDGIQDASESMSWPAVVDSLSLGKPYAMIFATCYGSKGAELADKAFGFSGVVDSIAAAYIAAAIALSAFDGREHPSVKAAATAAVERGIEVATGAARPLPLIPVPDWWLPLKLGLCAVLTVAYYFIAPATAPTTATQLGWILLGVAFIAGVIVAIAAGISWLMDLIIPWLPPEISAPVVFLKNFTGLIASYIGGVIAAYINGGTPHPNLFTWYDQLKVVKTGQAAAETATAVDPEPITRGMFAASSAILAVSFIDLMVIFTCILIPDSPPPSSPPPSSPPPPSPPPSGGGKPGIIDSPF